MDFYTSLAPYYGRIFPLNPKQVDFVLEAIPEAERGPLLDAGCANAALLKALAPHFPLLYGLDLDETLLRQAGTNLPPHLHLQVGSMLDLQHYYQSSSLAGLLCFGNTLVHLENLDQVGSFFRQSHALLQAGGRILLQLIHYDRILDQKLAGLPSITHPGIRFERRYTLVDGESRIRFESTLWVGDGKKKLVNQVDLLALRKEQVEAALLQAGFSEVKCYASFTREALAPDSQQLVLKARK